MSLELTLVLLAGALAVFGFAAWQTRKEPDPARGPRLIPWTLIAITIAVFILMLLAHLLSFFGIETGGRNPGL